MRDICNLSTENIKKSKWSNKFSFKTSIINNLNKSKTTCKNISSIAKNIWSLIVIEHCLKNNSLWVIGYSTR